MLLATIHVLLNGGSLDFFRARVRGAHGHPALESVDLRLRELTAIFFGRHPEVGIGKTDGPNEQAVFRVAGNNDQASPATFQRGLATVELQASLTLACLGRMAFVAVIHQNGSNMLLKEFDLPRIWFLGCDSHGRGGKKRDKPVGFHASNSCTTFP